MTTRTLLLAALLALFSAGGPARAAAALEAPAEPISLERAILRALEDNLDIRVGRVRWIASEDRVWVAWGDFDPTFTATGIRESTSVEQNTREFASTLGVAGQGRVFEEENLRLSSALQFLTPIGTRIALQVRADRFENTLNREIPPGLFYPEQSTFAGVELRQPLLRDFGPAAALAQVRIARIDAKISRLDFEGRVVAAVAGVMQSYYEMQYGHGLMRVQREAVEADRSLLALARRRFELGFLPALDVSQAEVAVSTDEENLLIATNAYMDAQFRLQRAVLGAESTEAGKFRFEPTSPLGPQPLPELNRDRLVALARSQRPEVISAARAVDRENIRLRYAKNQMAPRIDLIGTFGRTGLDGDRGNSFDETFGNGGGEQWTAGVQFSIPLANLTGRAQVATVRRLQQEAELSRAQTELAAVLDVDTVLSRIETNRKRVKTAGESTRLAEEAVRIANRQFEVGKLSGFDVLEQRKRLYEARSRELRAIADFNVNLVQLAVSSGTLLDERGIALESDNVKGSVFRIP